MTKKATSFGYLGYSFQQKLLSQILLDKKFADSIIEVIHAKYFDNEYFRMIMSFIKDYYEKYETTPSYDTLDQIVMIEVKKDTIQQLIFDEVKEIKKQGFEDSQFVQEQGLKFCQQQELKKSLTIITKIMNDGDFQSYDTIEEILKQAMSVGQMKDDGIEVITAIDDVLRDDFRDPIPTGIVGLDNIMGGGLSKGELGVFLAPFGVGKSTVLTKIANTAYNEGKNVLQIVFEDMPKVIQRKHFACWTGIELNELSNRKDEVKAAVEEICKDRPNHLIIKKFSSDGTTVNNLKQEVRKILSRGIKLDMIVLDYIDCLSPNKAEKDEWEGEGKVMRQFESLLSELELVGWTAMQGNRSSLGAEVVNSSMIGGSIKKGQIGHFIVSIAKTLEQKEEGTATMAILKSRFGKDGIIFEDCTFNNATVTIDTETATAFLGTAFNEKKEDSKGDRVRELLDKKNKRLAGNN